MMTRPETMTDMNPIPTAVMEKQPRCYTVDDLVGILGAGRKAMRLTAKIFFRIILTIFSFILPIFMV